MDSDHFQTELAQRSPGLTAQQREVALSLHEHGFALLRAAAPPSLCEQVRTEVDPMFESEYARRERRVPNAWNDGAPSVRTLATLPVIQDCLQAVYGRRPIPFQTLNFKWGSQQDYHADSIHFTSVPDRFMCGVWVALEAVHDANGPLSYYPGSHRVPQFRSVSPGSGPERYAKFEGIQRQLMERLGVSPIDLRAEEGDALIWTSHLLHGGRPILAEGSTRWSQVTHYFFEGCTYFQPIYSDHLTGAIRLLDILDLNTLEPVPHQYGDLAVATELLPDGRRRVALVDDAGREVAGDIDRYRRLEAELAALRTDRDALRSSTSFRLGNAVVAPAHWLRNRLTS